MSRKIALGTAQLGLNYGVTNKNGKVDFQEAKVIIDFLLKNGIKDFDTAQGYGDSEIMLGKLLPKGDNINITTKMQACEEIMFDNMSEVKWENALSQSLKNLGVDKINTLMIHNSRDLTKEGNNYLIDWLNKKKEVGQIKNIGVSIYEYEELRNINMENIDEIQVPMSIYDQRMLEDNKIEQLHKTGKIINVRSIFLQGLIVSESKNWPDKFESKYREYHRNLERYCHENKKSLVEAAMEFIESNECINSMVIGMCSLEEAKEIIEAKRRIESIVQNNYKEYKIDDYEFIDPRYWPSDKEED